MEKLLKPCKNTLICLSGCNSCSEVLCWVKADSGLLHLHPSVKKKKKKWRLFLLLSFHYFSVLANIVRCVTAWVCLSVSVPSVWLSLQLFSIPDSFSCRVIASSLWHVCDRLQSLRGLDSVPHVSGAGVWYRLELGFHNQWSISGRTSLTYIKQIEFWQRGRACDLENLKRWASRPRWPDDNAWYHV